MADTTSAIMVRLILRRDRILLPLWIVPLAVIPISYVQTFGDLSRRRSRGRSTRATPVSSPCTANCPGPASVSSSPGRWDSYR